MTNARVAGLVQRCGRAMLEGLAVAILVTLGGTGCSLDGVLDSGQLPKDVSDPALTESPTGAQSAYTGALVRFREAFGDGSTFASFVVTTGVFSDELAWTAFAGSFRETDRRALLEGAPNQTDRTYGLLGKVRGQAQQAIGLVTRHLPDRPALAGHLYALQGYAELFLAELFCSGIPLSTIDSAGGFTYQRGSTTDEVLAHAVALFDTALTLAGDSVRILDMARVGRGRALLARGRYAAAAAAVAGVADGFRYNVIYNNLAIGSAGGAPNFAAGDNGEGGLSIWQLAVPDQEGGNGLNWRSSGDPRSATSLVSSGGFNFYHPDKYSIDGSSPIVLASGVEARLIEAEAALHTNPGDGIWLATLNALRTDGTTVTVPADTLFDTLGVTGCGPDSAHWCATDGVTNGYFNLPVGYNLVATETIYPIPPAIKQSCFNYSFYAPCYNDTDPMLVNVYVNPEHQYYNAGGGGIIGMTSLSDPGSREAQVALLFRERAFWLFLTGHRQGDLRRLIRQYGLHQHQVYPVGPHPDFGVYGSAVTAPIPTAEQANPLFTGCISRDA